MTHNHPRPYRLLVPAATLRRLLDLVPDSDDCGYGYNPSILADLYATATGSDYRDEENYEDHPLHATIQWLCDLANGSDVEPPEFPDGEFDNGHHYSRPTPAPEPLRQDWLNERCGDPDDWSTS